MDITSREFAPGGAANTAMNLAALGARVAVAGIIGRTTPARSFGGSCWPRAWTPGACEHHPDMVTTTKIRISSGGQVMLRFDDSASDVPAGALAALAAAVPAAVGHQDAVVVCDYGTGVLAEPVRAASSTGLRPARLPDDRSWWWTPTIRARGRSCEPDLVTPNAQEAARLLDLRLPARARTRRRGHGARASSCWQQRGAGRRGHAGPGRDRADCRPTGTSHRTWARPVTEKQASGRRAILSWPP